jgi:hypothetical protein
VVSDNSKEETMSLPKQLTHLMSGLSKMMLGQHHLEQQQKKLLQSNRMKDSTG